MGGAYHGWSDQLAYGMRVPGTKGMMSKGVPNFVFKHTDEFFPNDLEDLERKLRRNQLTGGTAAYGAAININTGATFNMYGGQVIGGQVAENGGAIQLTNKAACNIYGGEITNWREVGGADRIINPDPEGSKPGLIVCIKDSSTGYSNIVITAAIAQTMKSTVTARVWYGSAIFLSG